MEAIASTPDSSGAALARLVGCPFCGRGDGLYVDDNQRVDKRLRFAVECVCGASGAPRESEPAAVGWWNGRASNVRINDQHQHEQTQPEKS